MTGRSGVGGRGGAAAAAHQTGLELLRGGDAARALPELEQAAKLDPENPEYLKDQGNAYKALGRLEAAVDSYRRSVAASPDYAPARYNLGLALRELDRAEEAEAQFRHLHERDPRDIEALFNLADLLATRSRYPEAMALYRAALEIAPDNPYLWLELGKVCTEVPGQLEDAVRCLQSCIGLKPDIADAHYRLGRAYMALGRVEDAVSSCGAALALDSSMAEAHNDLGIVLQNEGRHEEAAERYRHAIRVDPGFAPAHVNLGNVLAGSGRPDEALACYRKGVDLDRNLAAVHLNLGSFHSLRGDRGQAIRCYETVVRLEPDNSAARGYLLFEMQRVCDWSRFDELCATQRRDISRPADDANPFHLFPIPSTPQEQLQCARHYAAHRARAVARDRERLRFHFERKPKARLRIGWLSADFREHPGAHLIAELIELLDRNRLELFAYSYGPDDCSSIRERLTRSFDRFVDVAPLSHAEAATRIHNDGIDILLDMTGYTTYSRPEILALRPAPIQVNFLGYPGTMGAEFIDYLLSSAFVTPLEHAANYSEALVLMPGNHHVSDRKRAVAQTPSRRELGLPDGAFVFCCLNQTVKILPNVYAAWMRLLKAVPDSIVWLVDSDPLTVGNLRREAQQHGVGPERLVFAPRVPIAHHLARLRAADLFLDTFPYNAHSTAADALWVGLPVLTCAGATFASRMAASFLDCIGLPELITYSLEDYEALALRLARDRDATAALREKLSRNRQTSTLFDTSRYATHLESAFHHMWNRFQAGDAPRALPI